jgi:hypothetical protein
MNLDRQRFGREQIFDQQFRPAAARILEPDLADRIAVWRDRAEAVGQIAPPPDLFDPAGDEAGGGHTVFPAASMQRIAGLGAQP